MRNTKALAMFSMFAAMSAGMDVSPFRETEPSREDPELKPLEKYNDKCYAGQKKFRYNNGKVLYAINQDVANKKARKRGWI